MRWIKWCSPVFTIWAVLWVVGLRIPGLERLAYRTEWFDLWMAVVTAILAPLIWLAFVGLFRLGRELRPARSSPPAPPAPEREIDFE